MTLREESKLDRSGGSVTWEGLNYGCLQRIADATEAMSAPFLKLQADVLFYKRRVEDECACNKRMARRISALQGVITKLKRKQ